MDAYQVCQRDAATGQVHIVAELLCEFDFEAAGLARRYCAGRETEVRQGQRLVHLFRSAQDVQHRH